MLAHERSLRFGLKCPNPDLASPGPNRSDANVARIQSSMTERLSPAPAHSFSLDVRRSDRGAILARPLDIRCVGNVSPLHGMAEIVEHLRQRRSSPSRQSRRDGWARCRAAVSWLAPSGDALRFRCSAGHARKEALRLPRYLRSTRKQQCDPTARTLWLCPLWLTVIAPTRRTGCGQIRAAFTAFTTVSCPGVRPLGAGRESDGRGAMPFCASKAISLRGCSLYAPFLLTMAPTALAMSASDLPSTHPL
jgi:hypothetical protein